MKYQANVRNHYFWDSHEEPNQYETKMMIREYWRTAKEDETYRKSRNKTETIAALAIFGGIGCLFAMMFMIANENMAGALLCLSLFGLAFLINGISTKKEMVSLESYISGLFSGSMVFIVSAGIAAWIWLHQEEWFVLIKSGRHFFDYIYLLFLAIPILSLLSQVAGILIARKICSEEHSAQCVGLDLKLKKRKKGSSHYVAGTPIFSYRYQGHDYVAVDGCYTSEFSKLPKKDQYATIYVNPKNPEMICREVDWKTRILPMVIVTVVWVGVVGLMMGGVL